MQARRKKNTRMIVDALLPVLLRCLKKPGDSGLTKRKMRG